MKSSMSEKEELIYNLNTQISALQLRLKELEDENAKLCTLVSNCQCKKLQDKLGGSVLQCKSAKKKIRLKKKSKGYDASTLNHHSRRYVALKVLYFGQRFYGFASEAQMEPTVESEIFKALEKTQLLVGDKKETQYSRCGRTDKGVSAVGQVIALFLRSKLKDVDARYDGSREIWLEEENENEIEYVRVLNRALPKDIRVIGWCPIPNDFSARFSCLSREYKYFFWRDKLNLSAMETAGKKFVGEHDFRNFCKMDAANVHNYRRNVTSFEICPSDMRFEGNELYAIKIKGSAFLWHQVRCMVAVLFMIGQGLELPNVIDALLDTETTPKKPQFVMASEIPLVLQSCEFDGLIFMCSADAGQALRAHLQNECRLFQLQAAIFHEGLLNCIPFSHDNTITNNGRVKKKSLHVPLMSRPTEPSYEERRAKLENTKALGSSAQQN